jgi:hypothetical protein
VPYVITGSINKYFENWEECRRAYTGPLWSLVVEVVPSLPT